MLRYWRQEEDALGEDTVDLLAVDRYTAKEDLGFKKYLLNRLVKSSELTDHIGRTRSMQISIFGSFLFLSPSPSSTNSPSFVSAAYISFVVLVS